jgi:hypothetical protein
LINNDDDNVGRGKEDMPQQPQAEIHLKGSEIQYSLSLCSFLPLPSLLYPIIELSHEQRERESNGK